MSGIGKLGGKDMPPATTGANTGAGAAAQVPAGQPGIGVESDGVRERQAADFVRRSRASQTSERDRRETMLAGVAGRATIPALEADPAGIVGRVGDGVLRLEVPMTAGELGVLEVAAGTRTIVELVVEDGQCVFGKDRDRQRTRITFVDQEGRPTELDGPLWMDPDQIYIDANGQIRADVPCWPDTNITKQVLGEEAKSVPEDVGQFMALLRERGVAQAVGLTPALTLGVVPAGTKAGRTEPVMGEPSGAEMADASRQLMERLDLTNARVRFHGTFKEGPLRLGKGAVINVAEGAVVECNGTLSDMRLSLRGKVGTGVPIRSLQIDADGTRLRSGAGTVDLDLRIERSPSNETSKTTLTFDRFDLEGVHLETPGATRVQVLNIQHLGLRGEQERPALTFRSTPGHSALDLTLPAMQLSGVSGALEIRGTNGEPATLRLGYDAEGKPAPMSAFARIEVDSARKHFLFDAPGPDGKGAVVDSFCASLDGISLVDSPTDDFDLALESAYLEGTGRVRVASDNGVIEWEMVAAEGTEWRGYTGIEDLKLTASYEDLVSVHMDLAPAAEDGTKTRGEVVFDRLAMGTLRPPEFSGNAAFDIVVDQINLQTKTGQTLTIDAGTTGKVRFDELAWTTGDLSPVVDAVLELDLGAKAVINPGDIPGLEDAEVTLDAKTGKTKLTVPITVDKNGHVAAGVDIRLADFEVFANMARGMPALPEIRVPSAALTRSAAPVLQPVGRLAPPPPPVAASEATADLAVPDNLSLSIDPAQLFGAVRRTDINVGIPIDPLDDVIWSASWMRVADALIFRDKLGYEASIRLVRQPVGKRPLNPARAHLEIQDGALVCGRSKVTVEPPLEIVIDAKAYGPATLEPAETVTIRVGELIVERDPDTGRARLVPWLEVDSGLLDTVQAILDVIPKVDLDLRAAIVEALSGMFTCAVFGREEIALEGAELMQVLGERFPRHFGTRTVDVDLGADSEAGASAAPSGMAARSGASTEPPQWQAALNKIQIEHAELSVTETELAPARIDLGNDQVITFAPGSKVTLAGTPGNFTVKGHAVLGATKLGGMDLFAGLAGGEGDVTLRVVTGIDGQAPCVQLVVKDLHARGVTATGRLATAEATVSNASVTDGYLSLTVGGGEKPRFLLHLPEVHGTLEAGGAARADGTRAGARSIHGNVHGSLTIENRKVTGELASVALSAEDMTFGSGASTTHASLRIRGGAKLTVDEDGLVQLERHGSSGLDVSTDVTLPDGSQYEIRGAQASCVKVTTGTDTSIEAELLDASFNCRTALSRDQGGKPVSMLEIRKATVSGTIRASAGSFETVGEIHVTSAKGSITNLDIDTGQTIRMRLGQIDFAGNGTLAYDRLSGWVIKADSYETNDKQTRSTLRAVGVADDILFMTARPRMAVDLKKGAHATFDIMALTLPSRDAAAALTLTSRDPAFATFFTEPERRALAVAGNPASDVDQRAALRQVWDGVPAADQSTIAASFDAFAAAATGSDEGVRRAIQAQIRSLAGIRLGVGTFDGELEAGSATVGGKESMISELRLLPGLLVSGSLNGLAAGSQVPDDKTAIAGDITMRMDGKFSSRVTDLRGDSASLSTLDAEGEIKLVVRGKTDSRGNFAARSHAIINGKATAEGIIEVDGVYGWEALLELLQAEEEAERQGARSG